MKTSEYIKCNEAIPSSQDCGTWTGAIARKIYMGLETEEIKNYHKIFFLFGIASEIKKWDNFKAMELFAG